MSQAPPPRPAEEKKCEKGAPKWVVTFGDMMSLLLCFFVLLLSFSNMDVVKYKQVVGSLKDAFGLIKAHEVEDVPKADQIVAREIILPPSMAALITMRAKARQVVKSHAKVEAESGADWVRIKVDGDALFRSGGSEIIPEARPILSDIGDLINQFKGQITIEGHTDNEVPANGTYLSNYTLGAARAVAVLDFMVTEKRVDRLKLTPVTYADTRPRETNELQEGRARNRRVEFVFTGGKGLKVPGQNLRPSDLQPQQ